MFQNTCNIFQLATKQAKIHTYIRNAPQQYMAFAWVAKSQNYMIKGIVTDSITGEPLPYVAVI